MAGAGELEGAAGGLNGSMQELTFEQALELPDDKIAAWNLDPWRGQEVVALYAIDGATPRRLAWLACEPSERARVDGEQRARARAAHRRQRPPTPPTDRLQPA